jgi:L-asparaginase
MKLAILVTGGTFDKEYNELNGEMFFKDTHVNEMLSLGRSRLDLRIQTLMMKDSLYMTDENRQHILEACKKADENRVLITHGTDTMENSAIYLGDKISGKTIVLTGAMIPYKFGSSDGMFNLGSALAFAQILPAGIYIAMNGRYFGWDHVRKNRKTGFFEEK